MLYATSGVYQRGVPRFPVEGPTVDVVVTSRIEPLGARIHNRKTLSPQQVRNNRKGIYLRSEISNRPDGADTQR